MTELHISGDTPLRKMGAFLWRYLPAKRRAQVTWLLCLTVLAAIAEVLSLGSLIPFLAALASPESVFAVPAFRRIAQFFGLAEPAQIVLPLTITFCTAALAAGVFRIVLLKASLGVAFGIGRDIGNDAYRRSIFQPYSVQISKHSSEIINGISLRTSEVIFYIILPLLSLLSAVVISLAVLIALLSIIPAAAVMACASFALLYASLMSFLRRYLRQNSEQISLESSRLVRLTQDALGSVRDVLLHGSQEHFLRSFEQSSIELRKAQQDNQFLAFGPRFLLEAAGMILIATIAYYLTSEKGGLTAALPTLAALALGLQRLLPPLQQIYQSWTTIQGAQESLRQTIYLLQQSVPARREVKANHIEFNHEVSLHSVSFYYEGERPAPVLSNFSITLKKGARVGIVGESGSGKTTLLDLILGLLEPTKGEIRVDGVRLTSENMAQWQVHIAHVPQNIFLTDGTLRENIAFGVTSDLINDDAVMTAVQGARLDSLIQNLPHGLDTVIGENGAQLSGGQRQRIAIARAFYRKADLIVFDEATSALDAETETLVMESVSSLDSSITVLMVAHRESTLAGCSQIIKLQSVHADANSNDSEDRLTDSTLLPEKA